MLTVWKVGEIGGVDCARASDDLMTIPRWLQGVYVKSPWPSADTSF